MTWTVPVSSKGQITLPAPVRRKLGVSKGKDSVLIKEEKGKFVVKTVSSLDIMDLYGIVKVTGKKPVDLEAVMKEAKQARAERIAKEGLE